MEQKPDKLPFTLPDNYFDRFEEKLMQRIDQEEQADRNKPTDRPLRPHRRQFSIALGAVAALALIVVGIYVVLNIEQENSRAAEQIIVAQRAEDEYLDYINDELDSEEIEDAIAQLELDQE